MGVVITRCAALSGVLAVGLLAGVPGHASAAGLATGICTPAVTGATAPDATQTPQHYGPAGATVTVTGANFGSSPVCSLTDARVGAATIPASQLTVSPDGQSLSFTLPAGASGRVSVDETEVIGGGVDASNNNVVFIETPTAAAQSPEPIEGSPEQVGGSGFAPFVPPAPGGTQTLPGAGVFGTYSGCPAGNQSLPAAAASDSALSLNAPSTYCDGTLTLTFEAPADASRPMDCTDPAPLQNCIAVLVPAGSVDVFFFIQSLSPPELATVHPGDVIHVKGTGFGPSGAADLAGVLAKVRWTDKSIAITVPAGATTGVLTVQRATGDLQAVQIGTYLIPGTTPSGPGITSPSGAPIPVTGPILGPNGVPVYGVPASHTGPLHGAVPPSSHPTVRDTLTLSLDNPQAPAGGTVHYLVTLTVNGKPVSGAPVTLKLLSAPGKDAKLTPTTGTTNAKGTLAGTVTLSHTPGDHLILAVSGIYSDEAHVVGQAVASSGSSSNGGLFGFGGLHIRFTGNPVVVWLSVATGALILFGVVVNVEVLRRVLWALTIGRVINRRRAARGPA